MEITHINFKKSDNCEKDSRHKGSIQTWDSRHKGSKLKLIM